MRKAPPGQRGRGGQGGHEPRPQIQTRDAQIEDLAMRGWSQRQIATAVGLSQSGVSRILGRIERRVLRERTADGGRQKARQTLLIDRVIAPALRAWDASESDTTRRRQRQTAGGGRAGAGPAVAEIVTESRPGDPRFLAIVLKGLADLRTIWGLGSPTSEVPAANDSYAAMTEAGLRIELAQRLRLLAPVDPVPGADTAPTVAAAAADAPVTSPPGDLSDDADS